MVEAEKLVGTKMVGGVEYEEYAILDEDGNELTFSQRPAKPAENYEQSASQWRVTEAPAPIKRMAEPVFGYEKKPVMAKPVFGYEPKPQYMLHTGKKYYYEDLVPKIMSQETFESSFPEREHGGAVGPTYEAEKGEVVAHQGNDVPMMYGGGNLRKNSNNFSMINGDTHEGGGEPMSGGDFIYTDSHNVPDDFLNSIKDL
jgi:hypothetical protein